MRKLLYVALAALVCSAMASAAMAWTDDFESYPGDAPLAEAAPYTVVYDEWILTGEGYGGSQGLKRLVETSSRGAAVAPVYYGQSATLSAKLTINPYGDYCSAVVGLLAWDQFPRTGNAWYAGDYNGADSVNIQLMDPNSDDAYLRLNAADYNDANTEWLQATSPYVDTPKDPYVLSINVWYEVELTLSGGDPPPFLWTP